jgi:hypothetical protein
VGNAADRCSANSRDRYPGDLAVRFKRLSEIVRVARGERVIAIPAACPLLPDVRGDGYRSYVVAGQQFCQRPREFARSRRLPDVDPRAGGCTVAANPPAQLSFFQQLLQPCLSATRLAGSAGSTTTNAGPGDTPP